MATILVVDDDPDAREFLIALLKHQGHQILAAVDGIEALATIYRTPQSIDLIIADVLMPAMDGYELVQRVREDPALASIPVIFHTASYSEDEAHALATACGVRHMLHKPALPEEILSVVASSLAPTGAPPLPVVGETFSREHLRLVTDRLAHEVTKLESVNGKLAALLDLSQQFALERDPCRLLQQFCHAARNLLTARHAAIGILNDNGHSLRYFLTSGEEEPGGERVFRSLQTLGEKLDSRRSRRSSSSGHASAAPPELLSAPIASPSCVYGWLCLTNKLDGSKFTDDDEHLASILAGNLGRVYENDVLYINLLRQAANLEQEIAERKRTEQQLQRLSGQILQAQETERRRIARELHDEVGQMLTALQLNLQALHRSKTPSGTLLEESLAMVDQTLQQVRNLSLDLRPSMLDDLGLQAALRWYLDRVAQRAGLTAHFAAEPFAIPVAPDLETGCFRVAQEALTNTLRHACARVVRVELTQEEGELRMRITDDGVGFDVQVALEKASRGQSLGLLGLRERVALLGGKMDLTSVLGLGTEIRVAFPLTLLPSSATIESTVEKSKAPL